VERSVRFYYLHTDTQTDRQTNIHTDRQTDRQTDRHRERDRAFLKCSSKEICAVLLSKMCS